MNNIELRLMAEKNWREENLLKCINTQGKKTSRRSMWAVINSFPKYLGFELYYPKQVAKN
jgi:hypothetical protein